MIFVPYEISFPIRGLQMVDGKKAGIDGKIAWQAPTLAELDLGLENVANGFNVGTDGAGGITPTSLS